MYNNIPSERTSKRAIIIALLICIALLSTLVSFYFAWVAKDLQTQLSESSEELQGIAVDEPDPSQVVDAPLFTYPEIVQVAQRTEAPQGLSLLTATLRNWDEANKNTEYCVQVRDYAVDTQFAHWQSDATAYALLADEGVRTALISYFNIDTEDEQLFFTGINAVLDVDDTFAKNATMCASSGGARKFLLLDDVRDVVEESGASRAYVFPEVLEWIGDLAPTSPWVRYQGDFRAMDGYYFYSDVNEQALVQTGYGDAGYANWEVQLLSVNISDNIVPATTTLEKCIITPTEDYEDSIMTCEIEYTE